MRIVAAGGGSGGHVTPVAAVLHELAELTNEPLETRFVCDRTFERQARQIMANAPGEVMVSVIAAGKLRRYRHFRWYNYLEHPMIVVRNIIDIFKFGWGFMQSLYLLLRWRPDVVFAKGGYVCLPVGWAARILQIPLVIHDSDARPGLTSRLLASSATAIATGFPLENYHYDRHRAHYVGVPVNAAYQVVTMARHTESRRRLGLDVHQPVVMAMGGGLGSNVINQAVVAAVPELVAQQVQVIVIAGLAHVDTVRDQLAETPQVRIEGFVTDQLLDMLSAADIIVTRASATSLQEMAALAKTIVAVPARQLGDQAHNAAVFHDAEAAVVLTDDQLEAGKLTAELSRLLASPTLRRGLAKRLHAFARPDAARATAQLLVDAVQAKGSR